MASASNDDSASNFDFLMDDEENDCSAFECENRTLDIDIKDVNNELTTENMSPSVLQSSINKYYGGNVLNVHDILRTIKEQKSLSARSLAYRMLFEIMQENGDLYTKEMMLLAYQIMLLVKAYPLKTKNNVNLKYIEDNLPQSLKTFPWDKPFSIKNVHFSSFIATTDNRSMILGENRLTFASEWRVMNPEHASWVIEPIPSELGFRIKNVWSNEYLYAGTHKMADSRKTRNTYLFGGDMETLNGGDEWIFQPIEGHDRFRVHNMYYGEYLFVSLHRFILPLKRYIFLWRPYGCSGPHCEFEIKESSEFME